MKLFLVMFNVSEFRCQRIQFLCKLQNFVILFRRNFLVAINLSSLIGVVLSQLFNFNVWFLDTRFINFLIGDLNRAFVDIDDLKKFRQKTLVDVQMMKRFRDRIQLDAVEESFKKIEDLEKKFESLEESVERTSQRMRKLNRNSASSSDVDEEKVELLLKEIQNMKTQMFFLQQSILQMRTQEHLSLEVGDGQVGPAYNTDELTTDVARLKTEVEMVMGRLRIMEDQLLTNDYIKSSVFDIRNNALLEKIDDVEAKVDNVRIVTDACEVASESLRKDITSLSGLLQDVR